MFAWLLSAAIAAAPAPRTVDHVDLDRYLGGWYEVASFPAWFQRGCTGTTAEYSLRDDGKIRVVNRCFAHTLDGRQRTANGRAKVVDGSNGAKLKVSFFGPFWGDYWVLGLDEAYAWAVVGSPDRDYLWILSRSPRLDAEAFARAKAAAEAQGFDLSRLQATPQPADAAPFPVPAGAGG